MQNILSYESNSNLYGTTQGKNKVLKRFSMFDGTGADLTRCENYDEALKTAQLDYTGVKVPLYIKGNKQEYELVNNHYCVIKSDDPSKQIGLVGKDYNPVSNREVFGIAEELYEHGGMRFEVGGPSIGSKKITDYSKSFLVMRGDDIKIDALDTTEVFNTFVVIRNSYDGSSGCQYRVILQRLVCLNGMTRYLGDKKSQLFINVQHSKSALNKIQIANEAIKNRAREIEAIKAEIEAFSKVQFTKKEFDKEILPIVLKQMKLKSLEEDPSKLTTADIEKRELVISRLWNAYQADDTQNYNNTVYKVALAMSDFETHAEPLRDTQNPSLYCNRVLQGMVLTTGVMRYIAETRGIKIKQ